MRSVMRRKGSVGGEECRKADAIAVEEGREKDARSAIQFSAPQGFAQ